jgi:small subunit ribosomal protein S17
LIKHVKHSYKKAVNYAFFKFEILKLMAVKEKVGIVVSNKMVNTIVVAVNDRIIHKRYKKVVTRTKRYAVHDSTFNSSIGDQVRIRETKPMSKTKNWILISVLRKSAT